MVNEIEYIPSNEAMAQIFDMADYWMHQPEPPRLIQVNQDAIRYPLPRCGVVIDVPAFEPVEVLTPVEPMIGGDAPAGWPVQARISHRIMRYNEQVRPLRMNQAEIERIVMEELAK